MAKVKKLEITVEMSIEDIVKYDQEGMVFMWNMDQFRELTAIELRQLSKANRDRYVVFKDMAEETQSRSPSDTALAEAVSVHVPDTMGNASRRIKLTSHKSGFHSYWARPDQVNDLLQKGYQIAQKGWGTLKSPDGKGRQEIGVNGQTELILLEISDENRAKLQSQKKAMRTRAIEGIQQTNESEVTRLGGRPVNDETRIPVTPISRDGG